MNRFLPVKANASEGAKYKLTENELLSQMQYVRRLIPLFSFL